MYPCVYSTANLPLGPYISGFAEYVTDKKGVEEERRRALNGVGLEVTHAMSLAVYWLELVQQLQLTAQEFRKWGWGAHGNTGKQQLATLTV